MGARRQKQEPCHLKWEGLPQAVSTRPRDLVAERLVFDCDVPFMPARMFAAQES